MPPKLILLNGNPGMGKSTLAQRYADERPMTLNLDIDRLWHMMGQWQQSIPDSETQKYNLAYAVTSAHLSSGYDVIVPDLLQSVEQYEAFEQIAKAHQAVFKEIVLLSTPEDAVERCKARARGMGYADGFRPGGVLDTSGREAKLLNMHANMMQAIAERSSVIRIESVEGEIEQTYQEFIAAIS